MEVQSMDNARKWVMIPAESENSDIKESITNDDLHLVIRLALKAKLTDNGELIDTKGKVIIGSNVYDCLVNKSSAKHYNKFLELKASLSKKAVKPIKGDKSKSVKNKWEWSDEDD